MPIMAGQMIVKIMDEDKVNDECAGSLVFNFKDLLSKPQKSFFWKNLYGAPGGEGLMATGGATADAMNANPALGTIWKGRILVGVEFEESENPCAKVTSLVDEELRNLAKARMEKVKWNLMFEIGSCIVTPEEKGKYGVMVKIAENSYETPDKVVVGANYNRWNDKPKDVVQWEMPYAEISNMADVFVYLTKADSGVLGLGGFGGGKNKAPIILSYARFKAKDFANLNPDLKWIDLKEEPVANLISSPEKAGILSFRCSIQNQIESTCNLIKEPQWAKKIPRRPKLCNVRAFIYQCKELPAADEDGTSDPMIQIWDTADKPEHIKRTKCVEDTCDPMFYECIELNIEGDSLDSLPPFIFDVYDVDEKLIGADEYDFMGRCLIETKDASIL